MPFSKQSPIRVSEENDPKDLRKVLASRQKSGRDYKNHPVRTEDIENVLRQIQNRVEGTMTQGDRPETGSLS